MKKRVLLSLLGLLFFAGCETPSFYLNPALRTYSREDLEKVSEIKLPPNWNVDDFKKIVLGVHVTRGGNLIDHAFNARLQTELAKLKRFQVFSAYNIAGKKMFLDLADIGGAEIKEPSRQPDLNYILNVKLEIRQTMVPSPISYQRIFRFESICDWSLEALSTQTVAESGVAKGITDRMQIVSNDGHPMGGFNPSTPEGAICSATMKAMAVIANKIGNLFPVGGEITGVSCSGERLTLGKGYVDGVGKFHQVAVFARMGNSGKVAIPFALAEAMPAARDSNLHIYRWNSGNEDADIVIQEYRADPRGFLAKHKLYAVGYGMPIPPEWEYDSTEGDEKVLLDLIK